MIRNRLAELLSERGLKITQVAKDTNLSRNTITSTAHNNSKMIQYETINELCKYLRVTPSEFFEYIPLDYKYTIMTNDFDVDFIYDLDMDAVKIKGITFEFDMFIDIEETFDTKNYTLTGTSHLEDLYVYTEVNFDKSEQNVMYKKDLQDIPAGFHRLIDNEFNSIIQTEFILQLKDFTEKGLEDGHGFYEYIFNALHENFMIVSETDLPF